MKRGQVVTGLLKNKAMNDDVYALRRKVIDILYDLQKELDLPRIQVRICDSHKSILGVGRMKKNMIWITEECVNMGHDMLYHVVAHEIGHAVFGAKHRDSCPLMLPKVSKPATKQQAIEILRRMHEKRKSA